MKHLLIVMFIGGSIPSARAESELGLALRGGLNAATLAEDHRVERYGFSGGLAGYLQWQLARRFSLTTQVELLYVPRGAETVFEGTYLGRSRQHYLDVGVAVRPGTRWGRASVYVLLGGTLSLLASANKENAAGMKVDLTGELHRVDVGLLGGVGAAWHLSPSGMGPFRIDTIFLEARHDRGLLDTDAVNGGFKNRTTSLLIGLSFALRSTRAKAPPPAAAAMANARE